MNLLFQLLPKVFVQQLILETDKLTVDFWSVWLKSEAFERPWSTIFYGQGLMNPSFVIFLLRSLNDQVK